MNTLIVPLVGLAVVFVGLVVLIAIVKLMGVICGFVTGRRAETPGSVPSSGTEAEKVAAEFVNILTLPQIRVKFGAMYKHPNRRRFFRQHFFGMGIFIL